MSFGMSSDSQWVEIFAVVSVSFSFTHQRHQLWKVNISTARSLISLFWSAIKGSQQYITKKTHQDI